MKCRRSCLTSADCAAGDVCHQGYTQSTPVKYCAPKCTSANALCTTAVSPIGGPCNCNTTSGFCVIASQTATMCQISDRYLTP